MCADLNANLGWLGCPLKESCVQVYTYGAPYPGNHAFAKSYERVCPNTWHLVHDRDPVPRSGKFFCLFKRPG